MHICLLIIYEGEDSEEILSVRKHPGAVYDMLLWILMSSAGLMFNL